MMFDGTACIAAYWIHNFNQAVILIDYRHIKKQRNKLFRHINLSKIFYNSEEVTCLIDDAAD
jgi:hypothetical protein